MKGKVIVDEIYPAREGQNPDYSCIQVSVVEKANNLTTDFLGGEQFEKKLVAFQTMSNARIAELGLEKGDDLSAKMGRELKIQVLEQTTEEIGFQPKRAGADGPLLTSGGQQIYRKTQIADASAEDITVVHEQNLSGSAPESVEQEESAEAEA